MRLTITPYWWDVTEGGGVCRPADSGVTNELTSWPDLMTFQNNRLRTYQYHPREMAFRTPTGIMIVEMAGAYGLRQVLHVEVIP